MNTHSKHTIYFDLATQEKWAAKEWEGLLTRIDRSDSDFSLSSQFDNADFHVITSTPSIIEIKYALSARNKEYNNLFVWDSSDFPSGVIRGLYCSLKYKLYDPRCHRSFAYPIVYNEVIDCFDQADAIYDWCFFGGITSRVRMNLIVALEPLKLQSNGYIKIQSGPWGAMFNRSGIAAKVEFAEAMRQAKFVICPRGNGVGSIRLFETLKAGRVPIIVADNYVLPDGIEWESCAIRVRERDIHRIPKIVSSRLDEWGLMASAARRAWEEHFSDGVLLNEIGKLLMGVNTPNKPNLAPILTESVIQKAKIAYLDLRRSLLRS